MSNSDHSQSSDIRAESLPLDASTRSRYQTAKVYPPILIVYLLHTWRFNFLCDDAFISFRYAKNLADGFGLRFNLNESPPVEGFSNFLWVMLMSLLEWLELDPTIGSRVFSVACGTVLVCLLLRFVQRRLGLTPSAAMLTGLFLVLFPPVAVWSTSGLATMPFTLLVFVTFERLTGNPDRPRALSAGLAGLAVSLIRTEGLVWAVLLGGLAVGSLWLRGRRDLVRRLLPYPLIILGGFGVFLAWRVAYFGDFLSNTTYAKVGWTAFTLSRGWCYAVRFGLDFLSVSVILVSSLFLVSRPRGGPAWMSALMVGAAFCAAVLVGGDFMPFERLFVVCVPFLTILLACVLKRAWTVEDWGRKLAVQLAVGCMVLSLLPAFDKHLVPESVRERLRFRWTYIFERDTLVPLSEHRAWKRSRRNARHWTRLGRALKASCQPGESLVQGAIGAVGYYSGLHIYDLAGLVDRQVARRPSPSEPHSAGNDKAVPIAYFERHKPTYVYAQLVEREPDLGPIRSFWHTFYLDRPGNRDLLDRYVPVAIPLPQSMGSAETHLLILGKRIQPEKADEG